MAQLTATARLSVRGSVARSQAGLDRARALAARGRTRRPSPRGSPWSGLERCREDEQLGRVLVPLD